MADQPLFRTAALNSHKTKLLGNIILIRPFTYTVLTGVAVVLAMIVVAFLVWGTYTKRSTVVGQLLPDTGLVKVYVPQVGIVTEKFVTEGQQVKRGDTLYVLSSERYSKTLGSIQETISHQHEIQRESLSDEKRKTRQMQQEESDALAKRIQGLEDELQKLAIQAEGQRSRVRLSEEAVERYTGLLKQNYISKEQTQQKQEELLEQSSRLQSMERERVRMERELAARRDERNGLRFKQQNELAQIDRAISNVSQQLTESEAKRRLVITAPETGTATAVIAEVGQAADGSRPLVSIVPDGAKLQAHLYAPSRAIGFIRRGAPVLMRYQAYPYQKFGHAKGTVMSVSKTALSANDMSALGNPSGGNNQNSEPLYRITVALESQTVNAYGQQQPLQAGMLLDADVLQDTRRLYEWVLEPLYSLTGKL